MNEEIKKEIEWEQESKEKSGKRKLLKLNGMRKQSNEVEEKQNEKMRGESGKNKQVSRVRNLGKKIE